MSDKDEPDGFDWLASQFEPTGRPPAEGAPAEGEKPGRDDAPNPDDAPPVGPAKSGFTWGLRPGGGAQPGTDSGAQSVGAPEAEGTPPALIEPPEPAPRAGDIPTQAMALPAEETPTQAMALPAAEAPTQAMTEPLAWADLPRSSRAAPVIPEPAVQPVAAAAQPVPARVDPPVATEYLVPMPTVVMPIEPSSAPPAAPSHGHVPLSRTQWTLFIVLGSLLAVAALVALFFLGERLGSSSAVPAPAASGSSSTPTQAPSFGLASPGVHSYAELMGGECVNPFTTAWATNFTVVDCGKAHTGQLIFKGTLPDASGSKYPTAAAFKSEITPLCSAPTALDYANAKPITDLQVSFSYPPDSKDWSGGDRTYYCFVSRKSGGALPGNLSGTRH